MCGRYASSRKPEDLVEEFEIDKVEVKEPLAPDYNVAPTKQVYAVVQRPTDPDDKTGPSERQLRSVKWGLVPFWAKEPGIGNKMINARMETVHEKPAFRRPFASRRCLLPADGYFEWYPTEEKTKAGKPLKQPFFIRPADGGVLAMAGLYELWKDPTRDADDPLRFLWTLHGDHHVRRGLGGSHPRPDAADGGAGALRRVARPDARQRRVDDLKQLLVPAAPGRLEAFPVSTQVNNVRNNGPELVDPLPASS